MGYFSLPEGMADATVEQELESVKNNIELFLNGKVNKKTHFYLLETFAVRQLEEAIRKFKERENE